MAYEMCSGVSVVRDWGSPQRIHSCRGLMHRLGMVSGRSSLFGVSDWDFLCARDSHSLMALGSSFE